MIGVRLTKRGNNTKLRRGGSQVVDAVRTQEHAASKVRMRAHISRATHFTSLTGTWMQMENKQQRGRPPTDWEDDLRKCIGVTWRRHT